jgi:hypothetical protein
MAGGLPTSGHESVAATLNSRQDDTATAVLRQFGPELAPPMRKLSALSRATRLRSARHSHTPRPLSRGRSRLCVKVFSARVRGGTIVPEEGVTLPEVPRSRSSRTMTARHFETTPQEEGELLDAIAEVERGETVRAEELLERLRR